MSVKIFMNFPNGLKKTVTLSYDDGKKQDIHLMDILNRYSLKCTFNLNSGLFPTEDFDDPFALLTEKRARDLFINSGHEVAVHSVSHPHLEALTPAHITYEVLQDRLNLERIFGGIIRGMAYPYGTYNDMVEACLKACGIAYSRSVITTEMFELPTNWLKWHPTCHHNNPRLMSLAQQFLEKKHLEMPWIFYLWGPSYEFDMYNNWNVIEDFAALMGGRSDIWYATNIEIYDYIQDYQRLIWSAGEQEVYNPTARVLYFEYGGRSISLAPGESLRLD